MVENSALQWQCPALAIHLFDTPTLIRCPLLRAPIPGFQVQAGPSAQRRQVRPADGRLSQTVALNEGTAALDGFSFLSATLPQECFQNMGTAGG